MALLIHLRVRAVGGLRVTAAVTIRAVIGVAGGGGILCHALREPGALCPVLRTRCVARRSRLVADRRKLWVTRRLPGDADCLPHLVIHGRIGAVLVGGTILLSGSSVSIFLSLARRVLLLLLRFPFLADFFEF